MKVEEKIIKVNNGYKCKICDKFYKKIKTKKDTYTKAVQKHAKISCQKQRTRNIVAYKDEGTCIDYFKKIYGEDNVDKVDNKLFLKKNKKIIDNPLPKCDLYLKNEDKRIQYKNSKNVFIHNWTKKSHIEHIKKVWGIDLMEKLENIVLNDEKNIRRKFINGKNKKRKLKKLAINVQILDNKKIKKVDDNLIIKDLDLKKAFIHWDKNEKNNFYYVYGKDYDNMIHMTDDVINKTNVAFVVRAIYSDSGKTNLRMQNIFKDSKKVNEMIERINQR